MRPLLAIALLAIAATGCRMVSTQVSPVVTVYQYGDGKVTVATDYTRRGDDSQAADKAVTPSIAASTAAGPNATSGEAVAEAVAPVSDPDPAPAEEAETPPVVDVEPPPVEAATEPPAPADAPESEPTE